MKTILYEFYDTNLKRIVNIRICGWCTYCKDHIEENDALVIKKGNKYHLDCYKQMRTCGLNDFYR